jgi:Leucine carboxyl methyltransferase
VQLQLAENHKRKNNKGEKDYGVSLLQQANQTAFFGAQSACRYHLRCTFPFFLTRLPAMERVETTALDALSCKWSLVCTEYLQGAAAATAELISDAARTRRQTPLSNRFYYERVAIMDAIASRFVEMSSCSGEQVQLISLGAGLCGALIPKLQNNNMSCLLEVDTAAIVAEKHSLLRQTMKAAPSPR